MCFFAILNNFHLKQRKAKRKKLFEVPFRAFFGGKFEKKKKFLPFLNCFEILKWVFAAAAAEAAR